MKLAIVIFGALCFSQIAVAQTEDEARAGNRVSCVVKTIGNAFKQASNFPNSINACVSNAAGVPTDVTKMIRNLVGEVQDVRKKIEAFQRASVIKKIPAAAEVVNNVSKTLKTADQLIQRVNSVRKNPKAEKCINNAVNNLKNSFKDLRKC